MAPKGKGKRKGKEQAEDVVPAEETVAVPATEENAPTQKRTRTSGRRQEEAELPVDGDGDAVAVTTAADAVHEPAGGSVPASSAGDGAPAVPQDARAEPSAAASEAASAKHDTAAPAIQDAVDAGTEAPTAGVSGAAPPAADDAAAVPAAGSNSSEPAVAIKTAPVAPSHTPAKKPNANTAKKRTHKKHRGNQAPTQNTPQSTAGILGSAPPEARTPKKHRGKQVRRGPQGGRPGQTSPGPLGHLPRISKPPPPAQGKNLLSSESSKAPTLSEIEKDKLTQIAVANWSGIGGRKPRPFNPKIVEKIYAADLGGEDGQPPALKRVMILEISQYLEKYLWPHFDPDKSSFAHVMSIILMVNEKFRENIPAWTCFADRKDVVPLFFKRVFTLKQGTRPMTTQEKTAYLLFLIHCFQSLENELVRSQMLRVVSLQLWHALSERKRKRELAATPQLEKHWRFLQKKLAKGAAKEGDAADDPRTHPEVTLLPSLLHEFLTILDGAVRTITGAPASSANQPAVGDGADADDSGMAAGTSAGPSTAKASRLVDMAAVHYCERFAEFLIDMLSQLPTRRFLRALVDDVALVLKCRMSALYRHPSGRLFQQLLDLVLFYQDFPINDHTGEQLSEDEVTAAHCERLQSLQRLALKHWPKLKELAVSPIARIEGEADLTRHLRALTPEELDKLVVEQLGLISKEDSWRHRSDFLLRLMASVFTKRVSQRQIINELPLYPNEEILWDENLVPSIHYTGEGCLALPKLNLQFLALNDYLLRNFNLFRLEATYEIREDIVDVVKRVGAHATNDEDQPVAFTGWARMGSPIVEMSILEVKPPKVGEVKPAAVTANIKINLGGYRPDVRQEWDQTKQHDVLFLLALHPEEAGPAAPAPTQNGAKKGGDAWLNVPQQYGLRYVRGCEVIEVLDETGALMNDFTGRVKREDWKPPQGNLRTLVVALDTAQYQLDIDAMAEAGKANGGAPAEDVYASFNMVMRRKPKENNFKAVLECIRDLMNEDCVMPAWLLDIFLGYGDPGAAQYIHMPDVLPTIDFKDTFLDSQHLRESFPGQAITFLDEAGNELDAAASSQLRPPFRITFSSPAAAVPQGKPKDQALRKGGADGEDKSVAPDAQEEKLVVQAYVPPDPGPYPQDQPRYNSVRFTPMQVAAIRSGSQPGLTMVVGPPGTGKTDTAVQILHVLYHNCPEQRTLLITHSNQALNDIFEKIMERDVPARYLLRLGMGEQELDTEEVFSRQGRVNAMLSRRLTLLSEVERLARSFGINDDIAYTCETSAHFWLLHVLARWEAFLDGVRTDNAPDAVMRTFPFTAFFANAPNQPLFKGASFADDMRVAQGCFAHLKTMFTELEECRAFELLRTTADRSNYLMTKQAKIVAMTCTHAALKRGDFLKLGFKYDNLLMEESAQILEIETFIPMLLQAQQDGKSRLKRCVLIGDHHQLPPVVKNMAFQKYSHLDQSLFTRFIRLQTPYLELNAQGRARPSLSRLYNWRYRALGDLPNVTRERPFLLANAGFAFDYQLVDVPDFQGRGEMEPTPYFFQNLGEAEYVVSVFQYMRLLGYPANKISILTTYNGQKHLIRDVIERRCAGHPLFGRPDKVTTVDKFQGQQNDFILLSLVRTKAVGHLRDVRRLIVAMSRSRLGLFVFARKTLFEQCFELQPTFQQMAVRPDRLALVLGEEFPTQRPLGAPAPPFFVRGLEDMGAIVGQMAQRWHEVQMAQMAMRQVAGAQVAAALEYAKMKGFVPGGMLSADEPQAPAAGASNPGGAAVGAAEDASAAEDDADEPADEAMEGSDEESEGEEGEEDGSSSEGESGDEEEGGQGSGSEEAAEAAAMAEDMG